MANPKMALRDWKKTNINIVVVGEIGSGKTSFMSYVANMCRGRKLEELKDEFHPESETGETGLKSRTSVPTLYTIKCAEGEVATPEGYPPKVVQIMDTPGLGDARGIEWDEKHKRQLAEEIDRKLETIDAVIIMANGTHKQLGITTDYALKSIETVFPRSLIKNVGFVLSNCTQSTASFKMELLPPELQDARHWYLENPLSLWKNYQQELEKKGKADGEFDEQTDDGLIRMRKNVETAFGNGLIILNSFFQWLDECAVQPTTVVRELYEKVSKLDTEISNVISNLEEAEKKRQQIAQTAEEIERDKNKILSLEDYDEIYHQDTWIRKSTPNEHNTLCGAPACHRNCHLNCPLKFTWDKEALGNGCKVFNNPILLSSISWPSGTMATCIQCKHFALYHYHCWDKWVLERERLPGYEEAKKEYEDALSNKAGNEILKKQMGAELKAISGRLKEAQDDLERLCAKYDELAIPGSFAFYLQSAIQLLQQRLKSREDDLAPKEEIDRLKGLIANLKKKYGTIAKKRKEDYGEKPTNVATFVQDVAVSRRVFLGF